MKNLKFIIPVLVVFILMVLVKMFTPEPTDWIPSYSKNDKIPYGSYLLFEILPDLFPGRKIETTNLPFFNITNQKNIENKNIIIICSHFSPDDLDAKVLRDLLEKGNDVFIAANSFGKKIADSLKLNTNYSFFGGVDSAEVNFVNPKLKQQEYYRFSQGSYNHYITNIDTNKVTVLGIKNSNFINFLKVKVGKGYLYLHTLPTVFTNYNLLKSDRDYIYKCLSYLNVRDVLWDEYYKEVNKYQSTPIRYILSQPSLRWGYFSFLFAIILFVIFKGRRDQRIIPVIKPLANTTLEFIRTVGNLYFKQSNHKNIAEKKITYFMDLIRTKYSIKIVNLNDEMIHQLSDKSMIEINEIRKMFNIFNLVTISQSIKRDTLIELNDLIENFYIKTGIYGK
jgi:hypothetical protein